MSLARVRTDAIRELRRIADAVGLTVLYSRSSTSGMTVSSGTVANETIGAKVTIRGFLTLADLVASGRSEISTHLRFSGSQVSASRLQFTASYESFRQDGAVFLPQTGDRLEVPSPALPGKATTYTAYRVTEVVPLSVGRDPAGWRLVIER